MTTPSDLKDAICCKLAELWPDRTVYPDECPDDHTRPSSFVQVVEDDPVRVNISLVRWAAKILIALWGEMDDYGLTDAEGLMDDQLDVIAALSGKPLAVGDRYITLMAEGKGQDPEDGAAFVEVTASWHDEPPTPSSKKPQDTDGPLMETFIGHVNNKEVRSDPSV